MSTGIFTTNQLTEDLARKSFAGMITRLMPNGAAALFGMTSMLASETAVQIEHGFFTKTMLFPQLVLNGAITASQTVLDVDSTDNVLPGMIMQVASTGENIIINSAPNATQVIVQRGLGSVSAAIAADNVELHQVGTAFEEASTRPNALIVNPVRITNLTQTFRNTWAISGTAEATQVIAGDSTAEEARRDCAAFHAKDIESALFFGQKSQGTRNGQPFHTMDGLINIVGNIAYYPSSYSTPNVTIAGSTTNYTQLQAFFEPVFDQTTDPKVANERVLFVGGTAKQVITNIGRLNGTYFINDGQTNFGLQFSTFKTPRGTFRMIEHPLFNSNAKWKKMATAIDLSTFRVAYLGNRKTKATSFDDEDNNGQDAIGGTLTTEMTCVVKNPPANSIVYNLTAGAAG